MSGVRGALAEEGFILLGGMLADELRPVAGGDARCRYRDEMGDSASALSGGCLCGGVRFEVTAPLVSSGYCHCTRCQRRTGTAASASARVEPGSLRILSGEELIRAWTPPDHGFAKAFCSECGSHLWSQSQDDPEIKSVRLGAFDSDPGIRPSDRQFVAYAASWEPLPDDGLPRYPEQRAK